MKYLIFFILFFCSLACFAEIYEQTDASGNVTYSDTPLNENAKKISAPPVTAVPATHSESTVTSAPNVPSAPATTSTAADSPTTSSPAATSPTATSTEASPTEAVPTDAPVIPRDLVKTELTFLSPKDQDTLYNQPTTSIDLILIPKLKKGEVLQIFLDGKPASDPAPATHFNISILERGTHQLYAVLYNEKNQSIKQSNTITVFVHRTSVNNIINSPNG